MPELHALPGHRDMAVEDAIELGRRAIYHATFRDAVSGGTVSGEHTPSNPRPLLGKACCMQEPSLRCCLFFGAQCTM